MQEKNIRTLSYYQYQTLLNSLYESLPGKPEVVLKFKLLENTNKIIPFDVFDSVVLIPKRKIRIPNGRTILESLGTIVDIKEGLFRKRYLFKPQHGEFQYWSVESELRTTIIR